MAYFVFQHFLIPRHQDKLFRVGLRYQHAIERVTMMEGELFYSFDMVDGNGEQIPREWATSSGHESKSAHILSPQKNQPIYFFLRGSGKNPVGSVGVSSSCVEPPSILAVGSSNGSIIAVFSPSTSSA